MEDNTELELILVTSDKVDGSECGPDVCGPDAGGDDPDEGCTVG